MLDRGSAISAPAARETEHDNQQRAPHYFRRIVRFRASTPLVWVTVIRSV